MLHSRIFQFNPLATNCVVLWNDGATACTVVDPGMSSPEGLDQLKEFFERNGIVPDAILLTHGHFDHVWGVDRLLAEYPVPVYLHPLDVDIMKHISAGFSGMGDFSFLKHSFIPTDVADGQLLTSGGTEWKVLHTPGHTPGGVCYYSARNNLLLSGDTLFAGSIGRTDLKGGDYDLLMASIKGKLLNLPGETDVIPGHGQPTSIAREGMYNPFLEPFNEPLGDME
jgi:glyoxylase-like metal-dependent hydrolase (beta-lactamase superfamily II)